MASDAIYVGAYWGSRPEGVEPCASRLRRCLVALAAVSPVFDHWRPKGRTRSEAVGAEEVEASHLADALRRVVEARIPLDGAADHGVSEALYLRDPDQNGVELYWDRPKEQWPRTDDGQLAMYTRPLDVRALLREAPARIDVQPPGTGPRDL